VHCRMFTQAELSPDHSGKTQSTLISSCSEESGCDQDAEDEAVASTELFRQPQVTAPGTQTCLRPV